MSYPTLHTLNSVRVCIEFCIIHYHVSFLFPTSGGFLSNSMMADNLISFFFVLSGFVTMHSNFAADFTLPGAKRAYISKKFHRVYPAYLFWFLLDLPGTIFDGTVNGSWSCPLFWLALASQPILLHSWLGCQHIAISNGVGWYLCTLFWLWILFPFMDHHNLFSSNPWSKIVCLYLVSLAGWGAFFQFNIVYTRALPLLRICEFLMGCLVAFTTERRLNGWLVLAVALLFPAYCCLTFLLPDLWPSEQLFGQCQLWIPRQTQDISPTIFLSKFALVYCILIHYLASTEVTGERPPMLQPLHWDCFKSLSTFSLHAYLCHYTVACGIRTFSQWLGIFNWWSLDTMLLTCYSMAYVSSQLESSLRMAYPFLSPEKRKAAPHSLLIIGPGAERGEKPEAHEQAPSPP